MQWTVCLLGISIGIYVVSSLGGVALVKWLNYHYCFHSWWWLAISSRSTWILSLGLQCLLLLPNVTIWGIISSISIRQVQWYALVALGLAMVEVFNALSMSILPGSLYMLLKGSDVGWSMLLSYAVLGKLYGRPQVVAATLIMTGVSLVMWLDHDSNYHHDGNNMDHDKLTRQLTWNTSRTINDNDIISVTVAAWLCVGGAFLNALCSVLTEAWLKKTLQQEQERLMVEQQSVSFASTAIKKLVLSNAYSMWTGFFSFLLLTIPMGLWSIFGQQYYKDNHSNDGDHVSPSSTRWQWTISNSTSTTTFCPIMTNITHDNDDNPTMTRPSESTRVVQWGLLVSVLLAALTVSRFLERLAKYFICVNDSALTFSIVQAARRWSGIYILGLVFREDFTPGIMFGSVVSGIGFALYAAAAHGHRSYRADNNVESNHQNDNDSNRSYPVYTNIATTDDNENGDTTFPTDEIPEIEITDTRQQCF